MKKQLFRLLFLVTMFSGIKTDVNAQMFHIPDSAFRAYLNQNFGSCMVGDSIDPSCPAVLATKNINVSNRGISNLSGIEVFVNDTLLKCNYNLLTVLPTLPLSLTFLECSHNQITILPTLPSSLKILFCAYNQLTTLPALPSSVYHIYASLNPITSLPSLPSSLLYLYVDQCQLSSLPLLPNSLKELICRNNQIASLPPLPTFLTKLICGNNQLQSLPVLPSSITDILCNANQLTSLPSLPSSLLFFRCFNNQITSLPLLPNSLLTLECNNNQLNSLPPLPQSLTELYCQNNPLTCLPDLNLVTTIDFSNTQINCIPSLSNVINSNPDIATIPICDVFNSNGCDVFWNIEGKVFFDEDTNCNLGINDKIFKNQKMNLYKNGVIEQQTYTNVNGDYDFDTFSYDYYTTEFDSIDLIWDFTCPISGVYSDTISLIDSMKYDRDFGLKCKGIDLSISSIQTMNIRPASVREIIIKAGDYSNHFGANCATGVSGIVNITITGAGQYLSPAIGALTPNSVNGNVLTYNIVDFGVISYDSSFNFNILVDTTAVLGSQICIQVSISSKAKELNYNNNLLIQCFTVIGSFDPNDKAVYPVSTLDISGDRWLTYTIRFQNTGTASAEHIYITDTLSVALDWSTFNLLSFSHQPLTQVFNDGLLKFSFPNIHLPDSNTNEPKSHGYVQYKIRAKDSLAIGSLIENTANIFFDFNAPVITNTTSNTVINCSIPPTIITASICNGDAYSLNGALYYNDGTYQQKLITSVGCDSIVELQLTVSSIINTVSQSSSILQTTASGSSYQWIDCGNNMAINGATNSTFQPTQSGNYAVAVTYGNCIDTSACYTFSTVGLPSSIAADVIFQTLYFSSSENILLHAEKLRGTHGQLRLMDLSGRIIYQQPTHEITTGKLNMEIPAKGMTAGIYIVNLITEKDNISGKVVKY